MPELPEVETTLRGIQPFIQNNVIQQIIIRRPNLRWPIPKDNLQQLTGYAITQLKRRGKYLLLSTKLATLILHLGMSGRLRVLNTPLVADKHDHIDIIFKDGTILRFTDPRRFGALLWSDADPLQHPLLKNLGVEPLSRQFTYHYLHERLQTNKRAIKSALMDQRIVIGVGNIYVTEALFAAGIHPLSRAKNVALPQLKQLVTAIKTILRRAIKQGGTTLKDFLNSEGKPGYFSQELQAYGRSGLPCYRCQLPLQLIQLEQRSTVYCEHCQKLSA
jgi:formamidopyrimidine-DNA glycosylase